MKLGLDRLSLHAKATLVMLSIIATILVLIATVIIVQVRYHIAAGEQRAATSMARSLAGAAELAMAVRDTRELERLMNGFLRDQHVSFIAIYDDKDELFVHTARDEAVFQRFRTAEDEHGASLVGVDDIHLSSSRDEFDVFDGLNRESEIDETQQHDQAVLGRVVVGMSARPMREAQRTNTMIVVVVTMLAGVMGTLIVSIAVRRWTRRLDVMVDASEHISRGDFTCAVDEEGRDEIAQLAQAYNRMREAVRARDNELRQFNERLQQRVEERTRALARAKAEAEAAAESLQDSEARTRAIVESAVDGIITADEQGVIATANRAALDIFGYEETELIGASLQRLLVDKSLFDEAGADTVQRHETVGTRKDGSNIPIYIAVNRIPFGERHMITAVVHDLTEQKRLQRQLTQAQKLEAIGQLAAGVAHEINTPIQFVGDNTRFLQEAFEELNQVQGAYSALLDAADEYKPLHDSVGRVRQLMDAVDLAFLNEEIPAALQQAAEGVDRVAKIVRSMKEFAHPGSEGMTAIDLNHAIDNTLTVARNEWKYVADVKTDFADDLPPVACLPGELNQVMLNLIVNAAHAIEEHNAKVGGKGVIEVATRLEGDHVIIHISDTGGGIPAAVRHRVFDPFFTTKAVGKGTGQGLAMAHAVIVDKHRGSIVFETEEGHGTTFTVRLPVEAAIVQRS